MDIPLIDKIYQYLDWINHAQQELQDGILYLEKLKQTLGG